MNKDLIIFAITILLIVVGLCGCSESEQRQINIDKEKLIGTWANTSLNEGNNLTISYTFFSNNTYIAMIGNSENPNTLSYNGTWEITNNQLIVTIEGKTQTGNYEFSNNDKTITITDTASGGTTILTKI